MARTLHVIAARTIPYLPVEQSVQIWEHPQWAQCIQGEPRIDAAITLFKAVASRDRQAMYDAGQAFLDVSLRRELSIERLDEYAFLAAVLGSPSQGDPAAVAQLESKYEADLKVDGINELYFKLFKNYLALQSQAAVAAR